jgi:hypothetical protein
MSPVLQNIAMVRAERARSAQLCAHTQEVLEQSRRALAESRRTLERLASALEPRLPAPRTKPKRNKLSYKNRWLISPNIVNALRRAGVECNILVPDQEGWVQYVGYDPTLPRH